MSSDSILYKIGLKQVYIIVFSILVVWASLAYFTVKGIISEQQKYANLINTSGKQRMLSQRTQLYALRFFQTQSLEDKRTLQELFDLMKKDHNYLMESLPERPLVEFYTLSPNLDKMAIEYFSSLENFIKESSLENLLVVQTLSTSLLPKLNEAVSLYEQQSDLVVQKLEIQENIIFIGTLLTLLFEYLFLIKPITEIIREKNRYMESSLQKKEELLEEKLDLIDKIFENTPIPLFYKNIEGRYERVNSVFCETFGFTPDEILGKNMYDIAPKELADIYHKQDQVLYQDPEKQQVYESQVFNHKLQKNIEVRFYKQVIFDNNHNPLGFIGAVLDISATKAQIDDLELLNSQLQELSYQDQLTKIPNRRFLQKAFDRLKNSEQAVSLNSSVILIADIDDFKTFNDTYGHDVGDIILKEFAAVAKHTLRKLDIIGRWGGEEFLIICPNTTEEQGLVVAKKICDSTRGIKIKGVEKPITVSIGLSEIIFHDQPVDEIIKHADEALYHAKRTGKDKAVSYTQI